MRSIITQTGEQILMTEWHLQALISCYQSHLEYYANLTPLERMRNMARNPHVPDRLIYMRNFINTYGK